MNRPAVVGLAAIFGLLGVLVLGPAATDTEPSADAEPARRVDPDRRPERPLPRDGVRVDVVDGTGDRLPAFRHNGKAWVEGVRGGRYQIRVSNPTQRRIEVVVSVDGLDVLDGKTAGFDKRGYLVPANGSVLIDGFRQSMDEVATFRFSSVASSYAAKKGDDRNVGVIGVAVFEEKESAVVIPGPRDEVRPRPASPGSRGDAEAAPKAGAKPGIGTGWGEDRRSPVRESSFQRASSKPLTVIDVRYDDREGLRRAGVIPEERRERTTPDPFPAERTFAEPPRD